jgi:hypothetical protein
MGTQENLKGAIEKSWDFIRDSSIRISFEAFKTYRITRLKFEKNGIKKTLESKFKQIGEIAHGAIKKGEAVQDQVKALCKEVDDLHCNIDIVDQEIEKIEKEEPPVETEKTEAVVKEEAERTETVTEEVVAETAEKPGAGEPPAEPEKAAGEAKKTKTKTAKKKET